VHAGAGFVETYRYNSGEGKPYPEALSSQPDWETKLWGLYDVPDYTRSLLNLPLIVYSGQHDAQMQSALVMQEAFEQESVRGHFGWNFSVLRQYLSRHSDERRAQAQMMPHLVGEGMGHSYHEGVAIEIGRRIDAMVEAGRKRLPTTSWLQTKTLRYDAAPRLQLLAMAEHWVDTRLDASFSTTNTSITASSNVLAFSVEPSGAARGFVTINGLPVLYSDSSNGQTIAFARPNATSPFSHISEPPRCGIPGSSGGDGVLRKVHGLQGPMDDAFMAPFMVVGPTSASSAPSSVLDAWVREEMGHQLERWAALFRGSPRFKNAVDVTRKVGLPPLAHPPPPTGSCH
jgi:hypothetical protein